MQEANITVLNGTPLNESEDTALLTIIVTNTNEIECEVGSNAYYYVSVSGDAGDASYTFVVPVVSGTIPATTEETFIVENTIGTIDDGDSTGIIYYTPA